jgi:hypothetical protein
MRRFHRVVNLLQIEFSIGPRNFFAAAFHGRKLFSAKADRAGPGNLAQDFFLCAKCHQQARCKRASFARSARAFVASSSHANAKTAGARASSDHPREN